MTDHLTGSRCAWANGHELLAGYHDLEWGVPLHDETRVFEMFSLDCFQAGLSWLTILKKREAFLQAFDRFHIDTVAEYNERKISGLLDNPGIIRNKLKIPAIVHNAKLARQIRGEFGSFSNYIWSFSQDKTEVNHWISQAEIPATSDISNAMSRDMIKRGFKFSGSTICYAFMQSIGMVNDHVISCFRWRELSDTNGWLADTP
jgi:DNA-3-methyladenine glycosylase I